MNTSEQINELAAALAKAQAQIQPAIKDATNPHFRSKYADLSSVWTACREALTVNGLSVVQMPVDSTEGRVALVTTLLHSSGQWISSMVSTRLMKDDAQGVGSALTYLRRYALSAMVGVVADEDDDGNGASGKATDKPTRTQPATYTAPADPKPVMTLNQARDRFAAKFGAWSEHFTLPEPRTVEGYVNAARELADRAAQQQPMTDEDAIEAAITPRNGAAGVAR